MKQYPFLKSNLEALERCNASVHRWLDNHLSTLGPSDRLVLNRYGFLDWMLPTGKGLFGTLAPGWVYKDWRVPKDSEEGTTIIVGSNLGYGLNHLLPKLPCNHQVLVLEPRPEILLACLGHTDYRPFIDTRRLLFLPPLLDHLRETISRLILPCAFGKISLRWDIPSLQLGPEYALWVDRCKEILEDLEINVRTVRSQQDQIIVNEMQNLRRASREASPAALEGKAAGISGIVLGAGPSLERFAPSLRKDKERALFSSSFQTLPALQGLGLKPHFAMIIDPSPSLIKVYEKLDPKWAAEIPLIYSMIVCPEVVKEYPGPKIPVWTTTGLASHFRSGKELVLDVGGNVGVALARFLRWCGVDRLLLVGQDFSWMGARIHAGDHPAAGHEFRFDPRIHIKTKNRLGQVVFTAQSYLTPLRELERDLEGKSWPVFDLYGGGLRIRGSESIDPDELETKIFLGSSRAEVEKFIGIMKSGLSPASPLFRWKDIRGWRHFFESTKLNLEALSMKHSPDRTQVISFLDEVLRYLQQDPLMKPYLLNEVINLAGLIYKSKDYGSQELERCKQIIGRAEEKVLDMDHYLGGVRSRFPEKGIYNDSVRAEMAAG